MRQGGLTRGGEAGEAGGRDAQETCKTRRAQGPGAFERTQHQKGRLCWPKAAELSSPRRKIFYRIRQGRGHTIWPSGEDTAPLGGPDGHVGELGPAEAESGGAGGLLSNFGV